MWNKCTCVCVERFNSSKIQRNTKLGKDQKMPMCTVNNRKFGYILIAFYFVTLVCHDLAEARGIPPPASRSNSKSFRFPTSSDEEDYDAFQDSASLSLAPRRVNNVRNEGRNAILSLDNTPVKPVVPILSPNTEQHGDGSSADIIEADLSTPEDHGISNNNEPVKNVQKEDEALREALCPLTAGNISTNVSRDLGLGELADDDIISFSGLKKLRYDLRAGKCAEVGKREHCGENMIFVAEIDSAAYGYCECDFENKILRRTEKQAALFTRTPLVFHSKTNACYRLYEQAYCANESEWLVLSRKEKGPVCEQHKCSKSTASQGQEDVQNTGARALSSRRRVSKLLTPDLWNDDASNRKNKAALTSDNGTALTTESNEKSIKWVPLNGSGPCVKLFEKNPQHCDDEEQVVFNVGDIVPTCGFIGRRIEGRAIIRNACPPGSYYSIIGRCQPDWDF